MLRSRTERHGTFYLSLIYSILNPQGVASLSERKPRNVVGGQLIYTLLSILCSLYDTKLYPGFREFLPGERSNSLRVHFQANK